MANRTGITVHFLPRDADYFKDCFDQETASERFAGLMVGEISDTSPDALDEFTERRWFGMHGSHGGDYSAYQILSHGDGDSHAHPCDENGNLSLWAADVYDLVLSPLVIPISTMRYVLVLQKLIEGMLNDAAEDIEKKMAEIEDEEHSKKSESQPI